MTERNPLAADLAKWLKESVIGCQFVVSSNAPLAQKLMCESYQVAYESTLRWLENWEADRSTNVDVPPKPFPTDPQIEWLG